MSLVSASFRELGDARPQDVVILDANGQPISVFSANAVPQPSVANLTSFAANTTPQEMLAANANRSHFILYNDTGKIMKFGLGDANTVNTSVYTMQLGNGGSYESPKDSYTGPVTGWCNSGTGTVRLTEINRS